MYGTFVKSQAQVRYSRVELCRFNSARCVDLNRGRGLGHLEDKMESDLTLAHENALPQCWLVQFTAMLLLD